uniref:Uncharacterized protein n=1 Tax=Sodalis glossinidius TaxID=63612 RepID=Q4LBS1_SODGL|nr:hypothetical protein [Sodalis glossinidius]CAI59413.1 hypothetical protein pSG3.22 [Sodalis glossinidius]
MKSKIFFFAVACFNFFFISNSIAKTPTMDWMVNTEAPLHEITFGLKINNAPAKPGFYYAFQFGFTGNGGIGYTGIQPKDNDKNGNRQFMVLFSSFRKDSMPKHDNCRGGADGSPNGVTCSRYIPGELGDTFRFHVIKDGEMMTGYVLNETSGRKDVIGKWTVSDDAGSLGKKHIAFIENYLMGELSCDNKGWPYYEVKFLPPTGNDLNFNGTISTLSNGSTVCPGAITWEHDKLGTLVMGGYK